MDLIYIQCYPNYLVLKEQVLYNEEKQTKLTEKQLKLGVAMGIGLGTTSCSVLKIYSYGNPASSSIRWR